MFGFGDDLFLLRNTDEVYERDKRYEVCPKCASNELILYENNSMAYCKRCGTTFTRQELLDLLKEVNKKRLETIDYGFPDPSFHPGGVSRTTHKMKCPLCNHKFYQNHEDGCFMHNEYPRECPKCGFMTSTLELQWKLEKSLNKEEKK